MEKGSFMYPIIKKIMKKLFIIVKALGIIPKWTSIQKKGPNIIGEFKAKTQVQYTNKPNVGYIALFVKDG